MPHLSWSDAEVCGATCPVCGRADGQRRILDLTGAVAVDRIGLLQCGACEARYADTLQSADYRDADRNGLKFYLEQGAGIRTMLEPLRLVDGRPIRRYIEVGCSFGFVLDYARRVLGWQVSGFDPGFIASCGRDSLGLPIKNCYFEGLHPGEPPADLLFCSEVIEHIPDPGRLLALLRGALAPDGMLILTTPNGDALTPALADELLLPILSPGQHVILYNPHAIETALHQAGFHHTRVVDAGHQLRVVASMVPITGSSLHFSPALYTRYLTQVAADQDVAEPLGAGLVARLLRDAVDGARYEEAQGHYERLRAGYRLRYRFDIEDIEPDRLPLPAGSDFSEFSEAWPLNLTGVWYARGMVQLQHEGEPQRAARNLSKAMRFGAALRARLQAIGTDDAETAQLYRAAELARLHALARSDPDAAVATLAEMAASGATTEDIERARRRVFGDLVLLGHYLLAERALAGTAPPVTGAFDADSMIVDFACAIYLLNHANDPAAAAALLAGLRDRMACPPNGIPPEAASPERLHPVEIAWLSALVRCDPPAAVEAFERISAGVREGGAAPEAAHLERARWRLFTDLVNLGHHTVAERVLSTSTQPPLLSQGDDAVFAWGSFLLNHRADFAGAAAVFAQLWKAVSGSPQAAGRLWAARFHEGLAERNRGNTAAAEQIASEIVSPPAGRPPPPFELRRRVGELRSPR